MLPHCTASNSNQVASLAEKPHSIICTNSIAYMTPFVADLQAGLQPKEAGLLIVGQALNGDLGPGADDGAHIIHPHSRHRRAALSGRADLHTPAVRSCAVL